MLRPGCGEADTLPAAASLTNLSTDLGAVATPWWRAAVFHCQPVVTARGVSANTSVLTDTDTARCCAWCAARAAPKPALDSVVVTGIGPVVGNPRARRAVPARPLGQRGSRQHRHFDARRRLL